MNAAELEQYLTQFLQQARDAQRRFEEATALEQLPNDCIQDILHTAEFAPSQLDNMDIVSVLHQLRMDRREAKKELEVTTVFKEWAVQNKKSLDLLEQALGQMRKVLRRQPRDMYRFKTNIVGEKDGWLQAEPEVNAFDTVDPNQITLEEVFHEGD